MRILVLSNTKAFIGVTYTPVLPTQTEETPRFRTKTSIKHRSEHKNVEATFSPILQILGKEAYYRRLHRIALPRETL